MGVGREEDVLRTVNSGINYVLLLNGVQTLGNYIFKALKGITINPEFSIQQSTSQEKVIGPVRWP